MELWNDAPVTPYEGQSRRRLSPLWLSANTEMFRTACFLCVIGHREFLDLNLQGDALPDRSLCFGLEGKRVKEKPLAGLGRGVQRETRACLQTITITVSR